MENISDTEREWFRESAWIYPKDDERFLAELLERYKAMEGWKETRIWQNKWEEGRYPQYLASLDPRGVGGDTCHLWRDGQTWWPMSGDFSFDTEDNIELVLRSYIKEFLKGKIATVYKVRTQ